MPTVHKGYVDLDKGIFRRKPANKVETSKRQPTTPLPPRLLAHMRRWQRLGISRNAIIEYRGKPISRVREGWGSVVEAAGLGTDDPRNKVVIHTLRHTSISWYLASGVDIELVSHSLPAYPLQQSGRFTAMPCREPSSRFWAQPIALGVELSPYMV
jgi:integrase